jgi:hypothetical protein
VHYHESAKGRLGVKNIDSFQRSPARGEPPVGGLDGIDAFRGSFGRRPLGFENWGLRKEGPKSEARNQKSDPSSLRFDATRGKPKFEI